MMPIKNVMTIVTNKTVGQIFQTNSLNHYWYQTCFQKVRKQTHLTCILGIQTSFKNGLSLVEIAI